MMNPITHDPHEAAVISPRSQILLVTLLSLNFGIVFFDRNSLSFLMPFITRDMQLSNVQIGVLASALSLTWAISGFALGRLSDAIGRRKLIIVAATAVFSLCSFLSGLAGSFVMLLGARLLMGIAEGGVLPISQSLTARQVSARHRGMAMGVMQNVGSNLLGGFAAPILLVALATAYGWRNAFFLAGIPGIISALLIALCIRDPQSAASVAASRKVDRLTVREAIAVRNIALCIILAILLLSHFLICWTFAPMFLTTARGYDPRLMGWLMSAVGIASAASGFVVPALSDRFGRKPMMILAPLVGLLLPLGALFYDGPFWGLVILFFLGGMLNGASPLFLATIPSETVDARHTATVLGLIMGTGELLGGVLGPSLAGVAADRFGIAAPLWIMIGLAAGGSVISIFLKETAPRRTSPGSQN